MITLVTMVMVEQASAQMIVSQHNIKAPQTSTQLTAKIHSNVFFTRRTHSPAEPVLSIIIYVFTHARLEWSLQTFLGEKLIACGVN